MYFNYLGLAVAMSAAIPGAAFGQAAPDAGITYDCDTAANHFSQLLLPAPPAPFLVTGKVRAMSNAASKQYVPMTRLTISTPGDGPAKSENSAGLEFLIAPTAMDKPPTLPMLAFSQKEAGKDRVTDIIAPPGTTDISFRLVYDGAHVAVTVDGHERRIAFTAPRPVVEIVCSTGEFLYTGLTIKPGD